MWTTIEIAGQRVDLLEPPLQPRFGLIDLHDLDGRTLCDDPAATATFLGHKIACLCPHGGQTWWSDRFLPSFDPNKSAERWLLDDMLPVFHSRWQLPPKGIAITGRGMGGQGALRLAFKHPDRFHVVASLDAAIDHFERYDDGLSLDDLYPSREHCRQDSATLHIHPVRQPAHIWFACNPANGAFRGNDRLHEKLAALGIEHHFIDRMSKNAAMLEAVFEALDQQSRRLL